MGAFASAAPYDGPGFRMPKPGKQIKREKYPELLVKPPIPANNTRVDGKDRNAPCECGCGKKRKKCPNGHITFEPPAHELSLVDYRTQVAAVIAERTGLTHIAAMYEASHTDKYWDDQVITVERCADLVLLMYKYDSEPLIAALDADAKKGEEGGICARTACDRQPATCFNNSTRWYYCVPCARKINEYNPGCCVLPEGL